MFSFLNKNKQKNIEVDYNNLPKHIGIIMDGNGRWAKQRGLPRNVGHRSGAKTLQTISEFCDKIGIKILTVYAFSTENWKRPKEEVNSLMNLLLEYLKDAERRLAGKNIIIKIIGDKKGLNKEIQQQIIKTEKISSSNTGLLLNIAINYGSRDEIVSAVKDIIKDYEHGKICLDNIDEELFSGYLYTKGLADPDFIIRPSGEKRLSNFLLWQAAYSEFWFSNIYWPNFKESDMLSAISDFQNRDRRYGGV